MSVPHSQVNLTFSHDNSGSDEDHGQQGAENIDFDPSFEASCSSAEARLLIRGDLKDFVRALNSSEKQAELFVLDSKCGMFSTKILKYVSFPNCQNEFKEVFS
jgi:hypothetical protein